MKTGERIAAGCAVTYAALCLAPALLVWNKPALHPEPVIAEVTRVYTNYGGGLGHVEFSTNDVIIARTPQGLRGSGVIPSRFDRCRAGDIVQGRQQGIKVELDAKTCRPRRGTADDFDREP